MLIKNFDKDSWKCIICKSIGRIFHFYLFDILNRKARFCEDEMQFTKELNLFLFDRNFKLNLTLKVQL